MLDAARAFVALENPAERLAFANERFGKEDHDMGAGLGGVVEPCASCAVCLKSSTSPDGGRKRMESTHPDVPEWKLILGDGPTFSLERSIFHLNRSSQKLDKRRPKDFVWKHGVHALLICCIEFKAWCMRRSNNRFEFKGGMRSPAATLGMALQKLAAQKIHWPLDLCGGDGRAWLLDCFEWHKTGTKADAQFSVIPKPDKFPIGSISFFRDNRDYEAGKELSQVNELQPIAEELRRSWTGSWGNQKRVAANTRSISHQPSGRALTGDGHNRIDRKRNQPHKKTAQRRTASRLKLSGTHARGTQALPDWFRVISFGELKTYLIAAATLSKAKCLREILNPACVTVLAEKLADAKYEDLAAFYAEGFLVIPHEILVAVSQVIAADYSLAYQVKGHMREDLLSNLWMWFESIDQFYPRDFLLGINCLIEDVEDKPSFKKSLRTSSEEFLRYLVTMLLERGYADGALVLVRLACKRYPHFLKNWLGSQRRAKAVEVLCSQPRGITNVQFDQLKRTFHIPPEVRVVGSLFRVR